jgi:hypothetical protein
MKTIEPIPIWDNGKVSEATIFNTQAINVTLNTSATFGYSLFSENIDGTVGAQLAQGNLNMMGDAYTQWTTDNYAWDWVAEQLNLTITGDYIPPVSVVEETIVEETIAPTDPIV